MKPDVWRLGLNVVWIVKSQRVVAFELCVRRTRERRLKVVVNSHSLNPRLRVKKAYIWELRTFNCGAKAAVPASDSVVPAASDCDSPLTL